MVFIKTCYESSGIGYCARVKTGPNIFIVLPISSSPSRRAVQILRRYTLQRGLGLPDALIAAVAISAECKLITGNKKHFEFVEGLKVDLPSYRGTIAEKQK